MTTYYKATDSKLKCRDHQFEIGKTYKLEGDIKACNWGFHSCPDNPLNVLNYIDLIDDAGGIARFSEVEIGGATDVDGDKIASAEITFKAELSLPDFIKKAIKWTCDNASSGDSTQNASSGHYTQNASSGDYTQNASSGDYTKNASSGESTKNASSGDYTQNASSGHSTRTSATGRSSVISSCGKNSIASGVDGTWISLAEYDGGNCIGFAVGCIGVDGLKSNTMYKAEGGKLVEVAA